MSKENDHQWHVQDLCQPPECHSYQPITIRHTLLLSVSSTGASSLFRSKSDPRLLTPPPMEQVLVLRPRDPIISDLLLSSAVSGPLRWFRFCVLCSVFWAGDWFWVSHNENKHKNSRQTGTGTECLNSDVDTEDINSWSVIWNSRLLSKK